MLSINTNRLCPSAPNSSPLPRGDLQDKLLRAVRTSKIQQTGVPPTVATHKWSYASAFLYSLTLITTIGERNAYTCSTHTHTRVRLRTVRRQCTLIASN